MELYKVEESEEEVIVLSTKEARAAPEMRAAKSSEFREGEQ